MKELGPILGIVGVVAFIAGLIWLVWYIDKRRREAMVAWAQLNGFQYDGENRALPSTMSAFKLFSLGRNRKVKNFMRGTKDGAAVSLCDYQYTTGSGRSQQVHQQTIAIVQTPGRHAPHFFLRRQRALFDALGKMFGGQDINFDDDPAFSKAWVLQTGGDEQQLRHFMSPMLREALTQMADRNLVLEVVGDTLLIHHSRQLKAEALQGLIADAVNIRRHWS